MKNAQVRGVVVHVHSAQKVFLRALEGSILEAMRNSRRSSFLFSFLLLVPLALACSSDQSGGSSDGITVRIVHQVAGTPLEIDQLIYTNAAANPYSVTKFEYLISDLRLSNGVSGAELDLAQTLYGNAVDQGNSEHSFEFQTPEEFDTLSFFWGVPDARNITGVLPPQYDGMHWPSPFGGGYHAMRFEGSWSNATPGDSSYVLHAGNLRRCSNLMETYEDCLAPAYPIDETGMAEISLPVTTVTTGSGRHWTLVIVVDIQEWMNDPLYDFGQDWADPSLCPPLFANPPCTLGFPTMPGPEPQSMMRLNAGAVFSVTASEG